MTDVLSDVLAHLDLHSVRCTRLEASAPWSLRFTLRTMLKFVAIMKGEAWLISDGEAPVRLHQRDSFFLASGASYVVTSDPALPPADGLGAFDWESGDTARFGGADTIMLGGGFDLRGSPFDFLFEALPKMIHIPAGDPSAHALRLSLSLMDSELANRAMGREAAARSLADVLLVHALRVYAARTGVGGSAWLSSLADPQIGRALAIMHAEPGRAWTVSELARGVGMSRSAFADHFVRKVGLPPLGYLTRWRLERACTALRAGALSIVEIAQAAGYGSESAFGLAFKRQFGISPGRYRKSFAPTGAAGHELLRC
jgi:AraC-like DNA-binding protein